MSIYFSLSSAISSCFLFSNLSLTNFRNIKPNTTCLYSEDSTFPLNLFAESHRVSSTLFSFFTFFLTFRRVLYFNLFCFSFYTFPGAYSKGMAVDLKPHFFDGGLAFMFETKYTLKLTAWAASADAWAVHQHSHHCSDQSPTHRSS